MILGKQIFLKHFHVVFGVKPLSHSRDWVKFCVQFPEFITMLKETMG